MGGRVGSSTNLMSKIEVLIPRITHGHKKIDTTLNNDASNVRIDSITQTPIDRILGRTTTTPALREAFEASRVVRFVDSVNDLRNSVPKTLSTPVGESQNFTDHYAKYARLESNNSTSPREFASLPRRVVKSGTQYANATVTEPSKGAEYSHARRDHSQVATSIGAWSPADIQRLTDQVMKSLDQRIISHRERMGRI